VLVNIVSLLTYLLISGNLWLHQSINLYLCQAKPIEKNAEPSVVGLGLYLLVQVAAGDCSVYGMAIGNVDLEDGTSFTVANRLCDVLPAVRHDPSNAHLFRDYGELDLTGVATAAAEPDSGFISIR